MTYTDKYQKNQALRARLEGALLELEQAARTAATEPTASGDVYDLSRAVISALSSKAILRNALLKAETNAREARRVAEATAS